MIGYLKGRDDMNSIEQKLDKDILTLYELLEHDKNEQEKIAKSLECVKSAMDDLNRQIFKSN